MIKAASGWMDVASFSRVIPPSPHPPRPTTLPIPMFVCADSTSLWSVALPPRAISAIPALIC
jgi:hypothetical protein